MKLRTIATFDTTIPDDTEWSNEGEIVVPGGYAIACIVRDYLNEVGTKCDNPFVRDSYGWEFAVQAKKCSFTIVVQMVDAWILQCAPVGKSNEGEASTILQAIARCLSSDQRFDMTRWHYLQDFERGDFTKSNVEPC